MTSLLQANVSPSATSNGFKAKAIVSLGLLDGWERFTIGRDLATYGYTITAAMPTMGWRISATGDDLAEIGRKLRQQQDALLAQCMPSPPDKAWCTRPQIP